MRDASVAPAMIWLTSAWSWAGVLVLTKSITSTFGCTTWISSWCAASQGSLAALLNWFGHVEAVPPPAGTQAPFCITKPDAQDAQVLPAQPVSQSHVNVLRLHVPWAPHAFGQSPMKWRLSNRYVPLALYGTLTTTLILKSL